MLTTNSCQRSMIRPLFEIFAARQDSHTAQHFGLRLGCAELPALAYPLCSHSLTYILEPHLRHFNLLVFGGWRAETARAGATRTRP